VDRPTGRRAYLGNLRAVAQVFVAAASHSDSAIWRYIGPEIGSRSVICAGSRPVRK